MIKTIRHALRLAKAHIRCDAYLLSHPSENKFCGWESVTGMDVTYIAAATGSIWNGTIVITKVFMDTTVKQGEGE